MNKLYFGDNFDILREMDEEKIATLTAAGTGSRN